MALAFSMEAYFKRNYILYKVVLDIKPKAIPLTGDFLAVLDTNSNISKVYIGFNQEPTIPVVKIASGVITPFHQIFLTWEDSENNKYIIFLIGQEAKFSISKEGIAILEDYVGLAKDTTVSNILSKLDANLSTRASETTLSNIQSKVDIALSVLSRLIRWGRDVTPVWVHAAEVSAPAAGTALVSKTVSSGKSGYIYGFFISAGEANEFYINFTSGGTTYKVRIPLPSKGAVQYVDFIPLNEGLPADGGSVVSITVINAGSSGAVYQARLLYVEV